MILGMRYAPARFVGNNLLTAVGAAEVLLRGLRIDEKPFPKTEFTAMRDAMLAQFSEDHRDWFKGLIVKEGVVAVGSLRYPATL